MAPSPVELARLKYLDNASRLLFHSSPPVAARLQTVKREVAGGQTTASTTTGSFNVLPACTGCGTVMMPGWNSEYVNEPNKTKTKGRPTAEIKNEHPKRLRKWLRCSTCHRMKVYESQKPSSIQRQQPARSSKLPGSRQASPQLDLIAAAAAASSSENSNNQAPAKKRARGKKSSSLQALLADQRGKSLGTTPKKAGLNLMDFMKA